MRRRQFVASGVAAGLAGCSQLDSVFGDGDDDANSGVGYSTTEWTTFRGNAARVGRAPAGAGPGESLSVDWELTVEDFVRELEGDDPEGEIPPIVQYTSWPVLVGDLVVWTATYGWDDEGGERSHAVRLLAADAVTGQLQWGPRVAVNRQSTARRWYAPEVDDGLVYVPDFVGENLGVVVFDPEQGEQTRDLDLGLPFQATEMLVHDGTIYATVSAASPTLYAFDAKSGAERWSDSAPAQPFSSPFCSVVDGKLLYFDRGNAAVVARDTTDGTVLWREQLDLPRSLLRETPTPTLAPPVGGSAGIYAGGSLDTMLQLDVSPLFGLDPSSGDKQLRYEPPGTPAADSEFAAVNPDLSAEQLAELPPFSAVYGLPVVVDDLVVATGFGNPAGSSRERHCFAVDRSGSLAWTAETGIAYAPVAAGDVIYVASNSRVDALSTDGEHLDTISQRDGPSDEGFEGRLRAVAAPAVGNERLYVPSNRGLVAIG